MEDKHGQEEGSIPFGPAIYLIIRFETYYTSHIKLKYKFDTLFERGNNKLVKLKLDDLIKLYPGKWIALKSNTSVVVSNGKDIQKVYSEALRKGIKTPTLFKVPTKYVPFIG